jgi:ribonuclease BN (tRNA processing enzyme)
MAILLRAAGMGVLLDCGPTTLTALKKLGLAPADVDVILLSHHHGDHFGGVPFLALHECYDGARDKPLRVLGPEGTETKVASVLPTFFPGVEVRFPLEYRDLVPNEEFAIAPLSGVPFEVEHYSSGVAFGYRVEIDGKTVVFSGDTAWTDVLATRSADADLFICECSSFETPIDKHMSHTDLEAHRAGLTAARTLLVHAGDDVLAHQAELVFELAHDGMEVNL